ncbi:GerAB/ArcD/ProY family transporter [Paenibacillus solisilvae]|uniref:GerAB/ArcD/ProY family transporter n=1 Tax=Paenibacillus solisilvae TaxID=2486751 RepID=A0ABW0W3C9_9BACL
MDETAFKERVKKTVEQEFGKLIADLQLLGPWLTALLSIPFILLVFHMVSGIVLDVGIFVTTTMMRETPIFVLNSLIFLLIAFTVRAGIEVMVRMFTNLILIMLFFVFIVLLLSIPNYKMDQLLPIMPEGFKPIMHGAYFTFGFPYAEIFLFATILPFVKKKQGIKYGMKRYMFIALIALLLNIIILILSVLCVNMVLGPAIGDIKFSLYMVARMIDIQEIVQRIESVIGMSPDCRFVYESCGRIVRAEFDFIPAVPAAG